MELRFIDMDSRLLTKVLPMGPIVNHDMYYKLYWAHYSESDVVYKYEV